MKVDCPNCARRFDAPSAPYLECPRCGRRHPPPSEYANGRWGHACDSEPEAVVLFSAEAGARWGRWSWWAAGTLGEAPTYEAACAAAEADLRRRHK